MIGPVLAGAAVGVLGGLIGLGGAEFRLPLLIGVFGFAALQAVILNKAMSLVVVSAALPARLAAVPFGDVADHLDVVLNLLAGTLIGAWLGATVAVRLTSSTLYRTLAILLGAIAVVLYSTHQGTLEPLEIGGLVQVVVGVIAGVGIGIVASVMGVAGGELLIPTLILLYGVDTKLAGSLSLAVSLPTMVVAFARYSRDASFEVIRQHRRFAGLMAAGSIAGSVAGGLLADVISESFIVPALAVILVVSAVKVWRHHEPAALDDAGGAARVSPCDLPRTACGPPPSRGSAGASPGASASPT